MTTNRKAIGEKKYNVLTPKQYYDLINAIKEEGEKQFPNWEEAQHYYSDKLGFKVSKYNIKTAAGVAGVKTSEMIEAQNLSNLYGSFAFSVAELKVQIKKLEARLEKVERDLS